jgi:hypothetical protein
MGHSWRDTSMFVKVLLVLQTAIIVGLSVWMYNEYASNLYLQTYVASRLQGTGSTIAVISLGGLVATVLVGILLKAGNILGDIDHLSERVDDQVDAPKPGQDGSMPMLVLKVVEPEPVDEISRLHSSLRRWNERSK